MPKELEEAAKKSGRKKGLSGERLDAYVYGTLRKTGWKPSHHYTLNYQKRKVLTRKKK